MCRTAEAPQRLLILSLGKFSSRAAMRKRKSGRVRESIRRAMHDFGEHRQRLDNSCSKAIGKGDLSA